MKNTFIYTGILILLLNSVVGLIVSAYDVFNWMVNDGVIVFNTILLMSLAVSKIKDGFKFGLSILFMALSIVEFVIGLFLENSFNDNWLLILMLVAVLVQVASMVVVRSLSKYA